jgi:tRNA pseudouridine38-40 synthase
MQILLTLAYDGTQYAGWQRQANGIAVQQIVEQALARLLGCPVTLRAASRTDAGVHALGQRAGFDASGLKIPLDKLAQVINGLLPTDIAVTGLVAVPEDFNPRHALRKTYAYQILNTPCPNPLITRYAAYVPQPLDIERMKKAALFFVGRHDFRAFCAVGGNGTNGGTIREIFDCHVTADDSLIRLQVTGNGFLYNMVRILAGTVLYAGLGKIQPDDVPGILASRERERAGKTMPPQGLTLLSVGYAYSLPSQQ